MNDSSTAMTLVVDWMPTFCALAGYRPSRDLRWDGLDFWPVLTGWPAPAPRPLYFASPGMHERAVRFGDWKLIVNHARSTYKGRAARSESVELYNLAADPHETTNLAAKHPAKVKELRAQLAQVAKADNDAVVSD